MEKLYENSRSFKYSIHKLIELVKIRPIIWDSSREDFRSLNNKEIAWRQIYEVLDDSYRSADETTQEEIGMKITAKWRNIRDAFIRSHKRRVQQSKVKKYMHHDQLAFMLKLLNTDDTVQSPQRRLSNNSDSTTEPATEGGLSLEDGCTKDRFIAVIKVESEEEPTDNNDLLTAVFKVEPEDEDSAYCHEENSNLKHKLVDFEDEIEQSRSSKIQRIVTEMRDQNTQTEEPAKALSLSGNDINTDREGKSVQSPATDGDESFFASVLSLVQDMNKDEKLEFRIAVMHLIKETRSKGRLPAPRELRRRNY